jgi:hypothetical protein
MSPAILTVCDLRGKLIIDAHHRQGIRMTYEPSSPSRLAIKRSMPTSSSRLISRTFSSALGPQTAVTDDLSEPRPSVTITVLRLLHHQLDSLRSGGAYPVLPADMASTFNLTPSRPSSLDTLAGMSAYDVRVVKALVYSRFAVLSNSFRLTGNGVNRPVRVIVVPLYQVS